MGKFSKTESQYGSSSGSQADLLSLERKFVTLMLINLRIRFEQIALVLKTKVLKVLKVLPKSLNVLKTLG